MTTTDASIERGHFRFVPEGDMYRLYGLDTHPTHPGERGGLVWGPDAVWDAAWVGVSARVSGSAQVSGSARVSDWAQVSDSARVYDSAQVSGSARVSDWAQVSGSARVSDRARVSDSARVYDRARISETHHVLTATVIASEIFQATLSRQEDDKHLLVAGCFEGTVDEFEAMIRSDEWVEADEATRELRRPELLAFAAMCRARIAAWGADR